MAWAEMGPKGRREGGRPAARLDRASKATPALGALMAAPPQRDVSSHPTEIWAQMGLAEE